MVGRKFLSGVITYVIALFFMLPLHATGAGVVDSNLSIINLYTLLTHQTEYDGKLISAEGFICLKPDYPAIFLSYKDCASPSRYTGIGLHLNSEIILKREQYGHDSYGIVRGIFHTLKRGYVSVDSGLGGSWIAVNEISPRPSSFAWSFSVIKPLSKSSEAYPEVKKIADAMIKNTLNRNYAKLAAVFVPTGGKAINLYISDLRNDKTRLGWVFFGAPHSIQRAVATSNRNNTDDEIEVYLTKEPDEYLACVSLGNTTTSFQPSISYLLEGGSKFCFSVLRGKIVDVGDFLYR